MARSTKLLPQEPALILNHCSLIFRKAVNQSPAASGVVLKTLTNACNYYFFILHIFNQCTTKIQNFIIFLKDAAANSIRPIFASHGS